MATIPFVSFFERLLSRTDIATQMDLAKALGVNRSAVTQAKTRDAVPPKWILALSRRYGLAPDWLEFGLGSPQGQDKNAPRALADPGCAPDAPSPLAGKNTLRPGARSDSGAAGSRTAGIASLSREPRPSEEDLVYVPKAAARLCAGGGSFEIEAQPVAAYPFPRWWLAKMGSPSAMIFMDVVGESMEPGICNGDTVLVDQSCKRPDPRNVLAVALDDAIYLKRVERCGDGIRLHSDNEQYADMELCGDELEQFHIIGKVVWLCRECRY